MTPDTTPLPPLWDWHRQRVVTEELHIARAQAARVPALERELAQVTTAAREAGPRGDIAHLVSVVLGLEQAILSFTHTNMSEDREQRRWERARQFEYRPARDGPQCRAARTRTCLNGRSTKYPPPPVR